MKYIRILFSVITLSYTVNAFAADNNVYGSINADRSDYGINYEKNIDDKLNIGVGLAYSPTNAIFKNKVFSLPLTANWLWGKNIHKLETGFGATIKTSRIPLDPSESYKTQIVTVNPTVSLGYRYMPTAKGVSIRAAITPSYLQKITTALSFGLGYTF